MPKSVNAIEEEDVEKQTANSAAEEEADEEEFEIERILGYEANRFISEQTKKKIGGFYVKWKGYTSDDNSWVSVEDCHAEDLINEFWERNPEQRPKPKTPKQTAVAKGGKGKLSSLEIASSKSKTRSRYEDAMEVDPDDQPPRKKARLTKVSQPSPSSSTGARANGKSFAGFGREAKESADEHGHAQLVQRLDLMSVRDLKNKVQSVETVEMNNGTLFYFIILKDGSNGAVPSAYVRKTFPEVAVEFYEKHLRWKEESDRE